MIASLLSDGSWCKINSVLQAQVWNNIMTTDVDLNIWGAWTQPILSMFTTHAGEAIFPCSTSCLAYHLREWFTTHPAPAQHDAGKFAGWLRD